MLLLQKMFGMLEDIQHLIGLHNNLSAVKADPETAKRRANAPKNRPT